MAELTKAIGPWRGTAMMLNIVLGAGLLTLPGLALAAAGKAAILVWLACAAAAVPLLLVFGILGRAHPDAGGLAAVMQRAFGAAGQVPATFLFLGAVALGLPAIAITGGFYAAAVLGGNAYFYAAALIVAALLTNLLSAEMASRVNTVMASVVVVLLVGIAIIGWVVIAPSWGDVQPTTADIPGLPVLGLTFMMVFFAFTGWEVSANLGGEFRNPSRDFPLAMGLSFVIAVMLYLLLAVIVAAAGPVSANEAPFAHLFRQEFGPAGAAAVSVISVLMIFANLTAAVWAVSRMVWSTARSGLLPGRISALRSGVPLNAVFLTTGVLLVVIGLAAQGVIDLGRLLAIAGQNFLLLYAGAAAALVRLATRGWHRPLGVFCLMLVAGLIFGRGIGSLLYPAILVVAGLAVALQQHRYSRPLMSRSERQT